MKFFGKRTRNNKGSKRNEGFLLNEDTPFAVAEAYKTLRTNLSFTVRGQECKVVEITSAIQGEGKSTTAINLAIAIAESGAKVLLVDCDLRVPTDSTKLGIKAEYGLSNVLAGMKSWQEVVCHCEQGIDLLSAGSIPPNPSELISCAEMSSLMEELKEHYDYILMDAPPVTIVTDAVLLAQLASGVVFVIQHDSSDREQVNKAIQTLEFASANILGFVYTRAVTGSSRKERYYGYGYNSSYSYRKSRTP